MNADPMEQRLRDEGREWRGEVPAGLEARILSATRELPAPRPLPVTRLLAALLLASVAAWWIAEPWSAAPAPSDLPQPTATLSALQAARDMERVGGTWGQAALDTVEGALLAEVANWKRDARTAAWQLLDGIPRPMRRLLPLEETFPGSLPN